MSRRHKLEAAVRSRAEPEDNLDAWEVYGDWLQTRGDARGELIALQCLLLRGEASDADDERAEARVTALIMEGWRDWLGESLVREAWLAVEENADDSAWIDAPWDPEPDVDADDADGVDPSPVAFDPVAANPESDAAAGDPFDAEALRQTLDSIAEPLLGSLSEVLDDDASIFDQDFGPTGVADPFAEDLFDEFDDDLEPLDVDDDVEAIEDDPRTWPCLYWGDPGAHLLGTSFWLRFFGGFLVDANVWTPEQLNAVLACPSRQVLAELTLHDPVLVDRLLTSAPGCPLHSLRVWRRHTFSQVEEPLIVRGLDAALPGLRRLDVEAWKLDIDVLPRGLEALDLTVTEIDQVQLHRLLTPDYPNLTTLHLDLGWFASPLMGTSRIQDLAPLLEGSRFPKLRTLGLSGQYLDDMARAVATSPLVTQLTHLELTGGTLSDRGARALLDHASRLTHLEELDVSDNILDETICARLSDAFGEALDDFGQREPTRRDVRDPALW